jgi:acyl-CoA synthetase (AMP-forming)/AMP-acid ligase II
VSAPTFNLADLWEVLADAGPDDECLVAGAVRHTRGSLDGAANRVANALASRGVRRGDRVGFCLRNRAEGVEILFGCWKIGAVPVNLNWRYTAAEMAPLLADAGVSCVVVEAPFLAAVTPLPTLHTVVVLDGPPGSAEGTAVTWTELVGGASTNRPAAGGRSGDDLQLLYTGGTTGLPKGVMWRHEDYFFACAAGGDPSGLQPVGEPRDIAAHALPAYRVDHLVPGQLVHASGQWTTLVALYSGCRAILAVSASYDAGEVLSLVARERPAVVGVIGDAVARPLAAKVLAEPGRHDVSCVLSVSNGGAPLTASVRDELRRAFPGAAVRDFYGGSETGAIARQLDGSAGAPASFALDATTAVLDPDTLEPVPAGSGRLGLLARRGRVPLGYWGDPVASAATFRTDAGGVRWALLGDLASVEADGRALLRGRGAGCVNTGGEKVFPEEVEAVLRSHPAVADAVVVGVPDERWGEVVAAVVEVRPGAPAPSPAALQEHCRQSLAGYKVPRRVVLAPAPRTNLGKADWASARRLVEASR